MTPIMYRERTVFQPKNLKYLMIRKKSKGIMLSFWRKSKGIVRYETLCKKSTLLRDVCGVAEECSIILCCYSLIL